MGVVPAVSFKQCIVFVSEILNNQLAVRAFLLATRIAQRTVLLLTTATNTKLVLLVILVVVVLAR